MTRSIQPELLDELPPTDARAVRSRRDLRRLNAWMGNAGLIARALRSAWRGAAPKLVTELGGGDGTLLLKVLRRLRGFWEALVDGDSTVVILDRHDLVGAETREGFAELGWRVEVILGDALDWLTNGLGQRNDLIVCNLFLHHFSNEQLTELLRAAAEQAEVFVALEPRRSAWAKFWSRGVGLLGCGPVTRHDAPVSVRAGFTGSELSRLWPSGEGWSLDERAAGMFGHLFVARRKRAATKVDSRWLIVDREQPACVGENNLRKLRKL